MATCRPARRFKYPLFLSWCGAAVVMVCALHACNGIWAATTSSASAESGTQQPAKAEQADEVLFSGRVVDPSGKPAAGARIYVLVPSAVNQGLTVRDPEAKGETIEINGKEYSSAVNQEKIELFERYGLDRKKPRALDPFKEFEILEAITAIDRKIYRPNPYYLPPIRAMSDGEGRFHFSIDAAELNPPVYKDVELIAVAEGYGPAWFRPRAEGELDHLELRLVADVPIDGRVIDLDGQPVAGATVWVWRISTGSDDTLDAWVEYMKALADGDASRAGETYYSMKSLNFPQYLHMYPQWLTTDHDGRFELRGIGAERLVRLKIESPTIGEHFVLVMTRPGPGIMQAPRRASTFAHAVRTFGPKFDYAAAPVRTIKGTVRDKRSGEPLSGIFVHQTNQWQRDRTTRTDEHGRYELRGFTKRTSYLLSAASYEREKPYVAVTKVASDQPGLGPMTVDFEMVRGVEIVGTVSDKVTGKPVGAWVMYTYDRENPHLQEFAFPGNPEFRENPDLLDVEQISAENGYTGADGNFSRFVLPGRGLLILKAFEDRYTRGRLDPEEVEFTLNREAVPNIAPIGHVLKAIDAPEDLEYMLLKLTLTPGRSVIGRVVGPEGEPRSGVHVLGLRACDVNIPRTLDSERFTAVGIDPKQPRTLFFYHREEQLGGKVLVTGNESGPVTVRLQPCGTVVGRIVDAEGNPTAALPLTGSITADQLGLPMAIGGALHGRTDNDGRFRFDGLSPGVDYGLAWDGPPRRRPRSVVQSVQVESGEVKDLGDITFKVRR